MKYWWFLLLTILASTPSVAGPDPDMLQLIPQLLDRTPGLESPAFKAKKGSKEWEVSFCPDNTCDVIRAPRSTPASVIGDFSLLYLYYASGYIYLKRFCLVDARPYVPVVLARYSGKCPKSPELATAACVMKGLVTQHAIRLSFRRSDEGHTGESILDPNKEFSEAHLIKIKAWQADAWKSYP
jgi:hypothetical protein